MPHTRLRVSLAALIATQVGVAAQAPLAPAHAAVTSETRDADCAACHKALLANAVLHGPVAAGSCSACHVAPAAGRLGPMTLAKGATRDNTAPLCVGCHEDVGARLKEAHVHGPVASGDCISCHDAHGSAFPLFLSASRRDSCLVCHDAVAAALGEAFPHDPAAASCGMCHDPHASAHPAQLREPGNGLCLACHVGQPPAVPAGSAPSLFGRELSASEQTLVGTAGRIALDAMGRRGHPNLGHPVSGVPDPTDRTKTLSCVSCHQPHGAAGRPMLQFGLLSTMELCLKCHK